MCVNINFGTWDNATRFEYPSHMQKLRNIRVSAGLSDWIMIDNCLIDEIKFLWSQGIVTIESCCGHNKARGYIAIDERYPEQVQKMLDLGYKREFKNRNDIFICKTT